MKLFASLRVFSILIAVLMLVPSCSNSVEQELEEFYLKNKDNPNLFLFDGVSLTPPRNLHEIKLWNYGGIQVRVLSYDESKEPHLVLQRGDEALKRLRDEFDLDQNAAMQYLTKLFSVYKDLDVLAIYGMPNFLYVLFVVDSTNVVVYVPDRNKLTEPALQELIRREKKSTVTFDEHWFAYRADRPYNFGG